MRGITRFSSITAIRGPRRAAWRMVGVCLLMGGLVSGAFGWCPGAHAADASYPVSQFSDGKAKYFSYKTPEGITIKYFVVKSSDGVIRAAFDACDVCWPEGKGYTQKGDFMVCNNCGKQFKTTRVNEVSGGCNPGPLARKIENDQVVIKAEDITKGKRYFDFKGGRK
jgi:uncharacterized membrane protein